MGGHYVVSFPFSALTLSGDRKSIWPVKSLCLYDVGDDLTGVLHVIAAVVSTASPPSLLQ